MKYGNKDLIGLCCQYNRQNFIDYMVNETDYKWDNSVIDEKYGCFCCCFCFLRASLYCAVLCILYVGGFGVFMSLYRQAQSKFVRSLVTSVKESDYDNVSLLLSNTDDKLIKECINMLPVGSNNDLQHNALLQCIKTQTGYEKNNKECPNFKIFQTLLDIETIDLHEIVFECISANKVDFLKGILYPIFVLYMYF